MIKIKEDLTGQKFERLTVENKDYKYDKKGNRIITWLCKCDCGNLTKVRGIDLKNGHTKSCGCLHKEIVSKTSKENNKKYNTYDLSGEYGIGYTSKGEEFYFDLEDYDKIKDYCWLKNKYGYISTTVHKSEGKVYILMHRLITNCPDDLIVDHINHNKIDNRKSSNLRICTHSQNSMNRGLKLNNTSGITGISFEKDRNKYKAYITINGRLKNIGRFDNIEDAIKARKEAEEKYYGEFSYDNSIEK